MLKLAKLAYFSACAIYSQPKNKKIFRFWIGQLAASGDPAAACCSHIAELQNPGPALCI